MNERGSYGPNGHGANGLSSWSAPSWSAHPTIGADEDTKRVAQIAVGALSTFLMTLLGTWAGAKATPDAPEKGGALGAAAGFFFSLVMEQNSTLKSIDTSLLRMSDRA